MKEERYFYVPHAAQSTELPEEEARHALRVLRIKEGERIVLMDGEGHFHEAEVTMASGKHCYYSVLHTQAVDKGWYGHICLAIAPTKNMDRMEWLTEKATEVGFDQLTLLDTRFGERKKIRHDRLQGIVVAAAKQSRKPFLPVVQPLKPFADFLQCVESKKCYIAHCYEEVPRQDLMDCLAETSPQDDVCIMVGPEGDFSIDEVRQAVARGAVSVSLGSARLRTETAGLMAVAMAQLTKRKR